MTDNQPLNLRHPDSNGITPHEQADKLFPKQVDFGSTESTFGDRVADDDQAAGQVDK